MSMHFEAPSFLEVFSFLASDCAAPELHESLTYVFLLDERNIIEFTQDCLSGPTLYSAASALTKIVKSALDLED